MQNTMINLRQQKVLKHIFYLFVVRKYIGSFKDSKFYGGRAYNQPIFGLELFPNHFIKQVSHFVYNQASPFQPFS